MTHTFSKDRFQQKHLWFNHIYQAHHGSLLKWFNHKLNHHHQAEDLSQEVFYRILKNDDYLQHVKEPKAWLFGIAKHVVIDFWRRQQIEKLYLDAIAHLPEEFHPSAEHELCIRETVYQVHCILEQLPERIAQVFLLSQLDGLSYLQIAEQLNISETTVKRDMKQAFLACMHLHES